MSAGFNMGLGWKAGVSDDANRAHVRQPLNALSHREVAGTANHTGFHHNRSGDTNLNLHIADAIGYPLSSKPHTIACTRCSAAEAHCIFQDGWLGRWRKLILAKALLQRSQQLFAPGERHLTHDTVIQEWLGADSER